MDYVVRVYKYEKVYGVIQDFDTEKDAREHGVKMRAFLAGKEGITDVVDILDNYYFEVEEYNEEDYE